MLGSNQSRLCPPLVLREAPWGSLIHEGTYLYAHTKTCTTWIVGAPIV